MNIPKLTRGLLPVLAGMLLGAPWCGAQPSANIAKGESFSGPLQDAVRATDGIIDKKNFAVVQPGTEPQAELMLTLRGPANVERTVLYADAAIKKCTFQFKTSLDIFTWEPTTAPVFTERKDGLVQCEIKFPPRMAQYVSFVFDTGRGANALKIHEMELFARDITDIAFSGIHVENATETGVDLCWLTDVATTSKVRYSTRPEKLDQTVTQINLGKEHRVSLNGLLKGTDYHYEVYVDDVRTKPFTSAPQTFRTLGIPLPLFVDSKIIYEQDRAVISWKTNVGARAVLDFGDSSALLAKFSLKDTVMAERTVEVSGLFPSTRYQFSVLCIDTFRNAVTTGTKRFTTRERNIALGKPVEGTFNQRPDRYITEEPPILRRVNDGSTNYFTGMATSGDLVREEQWVKIDLEKPAEVDYVWVMWRSNALSRDFALWGSLDGQTWTTLTEHIDAQKTGTRASSESGDPAHITEIPANGATYRYIKLVCPKGGSFFNKHVGRQNFVQIMDVKVFPVLRKEFKPVVREIYGQKKP
jgi:hypothetical protein